MDKVKDNLIAFDYILMVIAIFNALLTKHWLSWVLLVGILATYGYKKRQWQRE